jgi:transcriptional regulator with XRE-family HTH domain
MPPTESMLDFGRRLRWLREACEELEPGMHSQEQWAEACNVDPATMSRWEHGFVGNNFDALVRIALSTEVDMDYLFLGVVPDWTPEPLRKLLHQRHPALLTRTQFAATFGTQRQASGVHAPRPPRPFPRRRRRHRIKNAAEVSPGGADGVDSTGAQGGGTGER